MMRRYLHALLALALALPSLPAEAQSVSYGYGAVVSGGNIDAGSFRSSLGLATTDQPTFGGLTIGTTTSLSNAISLYNPIGSGITTLFGNTGSHSPILYLPNSSAISSELGLSDLSNTILPIGLQSLGLQIPGSCDGFLAADGAMTNGSAVLTSASAGFTAADVGKIATVAGAGPNYYVSTLSVNTAGSGYVPGEIVTFASGVTARVDAAPSGAVSNIKIVTVGSSSTNPATLSQVSTTGTGTGLVINVTSWLRENLVTTIAGYTNSTTVTLAANANATVSGATWGYGSDYSATINAKLAAGVSLPPGICGHASTINLTDKTKFYGRGIGSFGRPQTTLMWLGAVQGTQVKLATGAGASGIRMGDFLVDGRCAAAVGVDLRGLADSVVEPIDSTNLTAAGIDISAYASEAQGTEYKFLGAGVNTACSVGAAGVQVGVTNKDALNAGNVNHNRFRAIRVVHKYGPGALFGNTDSNKVDYDFEQRSVGGTGNGLELLGAMAGANRARSNMFLWSEPQGGSIARGTESGYTFAVSKVQWTLNNESGAPVMTRETGATVCSALQNGKAFGCPVSVGAKTGDVTLKVSDSGTWYTNEGSGALVTFTLPASAIGVEYCFTPVTFGINVQAVAPDTISVGSSTSAAGGLLKMAAADANNYVCVRSGSTGRWQVGELSGKVALDSGLAIYGQMDTSVAIDAPTSTTKIATATLTKTTDTTLATVTGLSVPMAASKTYVCRGWLSVTSGAAGGLKVKLSASGGLTVSAIRFNTMAYNGTTLAANATTFALSSNIVAANAVYTDVFITGMVTSSVAGSLDVQAAQNTSDATAATVVQNSNFGCTRIN